MKKWLSYTIDGILVAIIAVLGYVQVSMIVTRDKNHGVPMAFGSSFLYVATDSMDDPDNNSIWKGSGIIISKTDPAKLTPSSPIIEKREDGSEFVVDYDKKGDVVTFFYSKIGAPDTHRLIDKNYNEETGKWEFMTMGDNPNAHAAKSIEIWNEDDFIGKVVYQAGWLGSLLTMTSPDAAATAEAVTGEKKTAWLLPTLVVGTLVVLAGLSIFDVFREARAKEKAQEEEMTKLMISEGIDLNDEVAVETFKAKEEFKQEYRAKLEEEKERALKEARKELAKKNKKEGK